MAHSYWTASMPQGDLNGTATSLLRESAGAWEYRSLIDGGWHSYASEPDRSTMRSVTEAESERMYNNAPAELYLYLQRQMTVGGRTVPGAVIRRVPSPESYVDEAFVTDRRTGSHGWDSTNVISDAATSIGRVDGPDLAPISFPQAQAYIQKAKGDTALQFFTRPFALRDQELKARANAARKTTRFGGSSLSSVREESAVSSPYRPRAADQRKGGMVK